jgi:hypothetical protein
MTRVTLLARAIVPRAVWAKDDRNERRKQSNMSRTDSSHASYREERAMPRLEMVMPRLTHEQMLAILRESGVPESEARRWVDREARLSSDLSAGTS